MLDLSDTCTRIFLAIAALAVVILLAQLLAWWQKWEP
jgi:hypothetical protein